MEPSVAKRLMLAKYQLIAGKQELAAASEFAAGEAVLRIHDALETFMLAVADHVGAPRAWFEFHKYPDRISKHANGKPFLHMKVVNEVNDLRSPMKHYGRYPQLRDVLDLTTRIDEVFEDNSMQFLGVSFNAIRMASTIRHARTSELVLLAEDALDAGQFFEAMSQLSAAFQMFMGHFERFGLPEQAAYRFELPPELIRERDVGRWLFQDPNQQRVLTDINREWQAAAEQLKLAMLGINVAEYRTFEYLCPSASLNDFGDVIDPGYRQDGGRLRYNQANATFCLNFVLETVIQLQAVTEVLDLRSFFDVRLKVAAPYYRNGGSEPVGELPQGHVIEHTELGIATGPVDECFIWESGADHLHVSADVCDVLRAVKRGVYWADRRKAEVLARRGPSDEPLESK